MLERKQPMRRMSQQRRDERGAAGDLTPFTTLPPAAPINRAGGGRMAALDRKPAKPSRKGPAVPPAVRDALAERAGLWCEIQRPGCLGQGTDPSHRITQKSGGRHGEAKTRHDRLSNLMWACRRCHDFVTNNPQASKAPNVGWALEEWQSPAECPALYRGRLVLLADDGSLTFCSPNHDHTPA